MVKRKIAGISFFILGFVLINTVSPDWFKSEKSKSAEIYRTAYSPLLDGPAVEINNKIFKVELATTSLAVKQGLSGRAILATDAGMLFIFEKPYIYSFWMLNMNFPLDIIWIEEERIVDIDENVPNNFNAAAPIFYRPENAVSYVLEVNAGTVPTNNIKVGDQVVFYGVE